MVKMNDVRKAYSKIIAYAVLGIIIGKIISRLSKQDLKCHKREIVEQLLGEILSK